jgi:beta-N-acetylhexosaminidase
MVLPIETMSLEEKIGQMLAVGFDGLEAPDYILKWLAEGRVGAIILFARNIQSPEQVVRLTHSLHAAARYPLLICIDQEGGTVARLRAADGFTESPGAMALGAADNEELAEHVSAALGREMRAVGINWNLAPAIDVTHDIRNPTMGTRSLGTNPERVSALAAAQVRGFQKAGVMATGKHFPGLGNTPIDTHVALAIIPGSVDYLWDHDLVPFRAVIENGIDSIMINHVQFEALDAQYPSTLSHAIVTKLLRQDLGFDGLVVTDCLEMNAIADHHAPGRSALLAALAGNDVILVSHTRSTQNDSYMGMIMAAQSGELPLDRIDDAVRHIDIMKEKYALAAESITTDNTRMVVRSAVHASLMLDAARRAIVLVKNDSSLFPLDPGLRYGVVEMAGFNDTVAVEKGDPTLFISRLAAVRPDIITSTIMFGEKESRRINSAKHIAQDCDVLILVTRNAHMNPYQVEIGMACIERAKQTILVCARNPFDADVFQNADVILCTCGDSTPSLDAAVDVLVGKCSSTAHLPVPLQSEFTA